MNVYSIIASNIENGRRERSALWLADARKKCESLSELPPNRAAVLYTWLHTGPAYLTEQDCAALTQLRNQVRAHLARQKIEWLLQEFSKLSKDQQKALFERLRLIVDS